MVRKLLAAFLVVTIFNGPSLAAPIVQRSAGTPTIQRSAGTPTFQRLGRMTPTGTYYKGFVPFYDGDYATALKTFQAELRGSIKTSQSLWIDSICYETMCGECYYQMGDFDHAMFHYLQRPAALQAISRLDDESAVRAVDRASPAQRAEGRFLGRFHAAGQVGPLPPRRADHPIDHRHQPVQQGRRHRATALWLSDHAARDRPLHDLGPAPPGGIVGTGRQIRSIEQRHGDCAKPAGRIAEPLVRRVDRRRAWPGAAGEWKRSAGNHLSCSGPSWPAESSTIR